MPDELKPILAFVDCETTGTNPNKNSIFSFAMKIYSGKDLMLEHYDNAAPFPNDVGSPQLKQMHGETIESLKRFKPQDEFIYDLKVKLETLIDPYNKEDKLFLVAYSAVFDYDFLRSTFMRIGDRYFGSYFWYPPICAMQLAAAFFMNVRHTLNNFKLAYVYEMVTGNPPDQDRLHEANYDLELLIGLYKALDPDYFKSGYVLSEETDDDIPF